MHAHRLSKDIRGMIVNVRKIQEAKTKEKRDREREREKVQRLVCEAGSRRRMYTALSCPSQKPITSANVEHRLFMARKREQEAERGRRMDRRRTREQGERWGTGKRKQPSHTRNEGRKYTSLRVPDHFVPAAQRRYSTIDRYTLCPIIRNRVVYCITRRRGSAGSSFYSLVLTRSFLR